MDIFCHKDIGARLEEAGVHVVEVVGGGWAGSVQAGGGVGGGAGAGKIARVHARCDDPMPQMVVPL